MSWWQWDSPHAHRNTQMDVFHVGTLTTTLEQLLYVLWKHIFMRREYHQWLFSFFFYWNLWTNFFFSPLFSSLSLFYFLSLLNRCEQTRLVRFLPSMPPAQQHRGATVLTTGRLLALALFLALQVKCSDKITISSEAELPRALFFHIHYLFPIYYFWQPC